MRALALAALLSPLALTACPPPGCGDPADPEIILGRGAADAFVPFEDLEEITLSIAPQGGMGVSVRALTQGLVTDEVSMLTLLTEIDGEEVGRFETSGIFTCQEDGHGLLWGQVVGFDPGRYPTIDDLIGLDGQAVDLVVRATDIDGTTSEGRSTITLRVSR